MAEQDDPTLLEAVQDTINERLFGTRTAMLCQVVSYKDTPRPMVTVNVSARKWRREGDQIVRTPEVTLDDVPVMELGWGPLVVRGSLASGDQGVLLVCDRDIDEWVTKSGGDANGRYDTGLALIHDINDALFMPMMQSNDRAATPRVKARNLVIGDRAGTISITFDEPGKSIEIKASGPVNVVSPAVTLGSTGTPLPIARVGTDFVVVPPGVAGGSFPIVPGPIPGGPASAHKVQG